MSLETARAERDNAIERVTANAGEEWAEEAYEALRFFAFRRKHEYKDEFWPWEVSEYAAEFGYGEPPDKRAWGGVFKRAQREGLIKRGVTPKQHPYRHATQTLSWVVV